MSRGSAPSVLAADTPLTAVSCCLPVFPDLLSAIPTGLHVTVIFFCGVVTLFSCVATGFFFFNAFGRPYETLQGPVGLYLWTFITCENHTLTASPARIR